MKKKITILLMVAVLAIVCTGCMQSTTDTFISKDGTVKVTVLECLEKDAADHGMEDGNGTVEINGKDVKTLPVVTIDGVEYYKDSKTTTYKSIKDFKDNEIASNTNDLSANAIYEISTDTIYYETNSMLSSLLDSLKKSSINHITPFLQISYEFEDPIIGTNGKIDPENPNRVTFTCTPDNIYDEVFVTTTNKIKEDIKAAYEKEQLKNTKPKVPTNNTQNVAKPVIKNMRITKNKKQKVIIKWSKINKVKKYTVKYKINGKKYKSKTTKTNKVILTKLKKGKRYTVKISAKNGKWSTIKFKVK